jgi:hypothetical protein
MVHRFYELWDNRQVVEKVELLHMVMRAVVFLRQVPRYYECLNGVELTPSL